MQIEPSESAFTETYGRGQAQVMFASVPGLLTEKSDRVRPLAMAEMKRSALMPELPTIDESGLPGFEVANWAGLLGPAGLDQKIDRAVKITADRIALCGEASRITLSGAISG